MAFQDSIAAHAGCEVRSAAGSFVPSNLSTPVNSGQLPTSRSVANCREMSRSTPQYAKRTQSPMIDHFPLPLDLRVARIRSAMTKPLLILVALLLLAPPLLAASDTMRAIRFHEFGGPEVLK